MASTFVINRSEGATRWGWQLEKDGKPIVVSIDTFTSEREARDNIAEVKKAVRNFGIKIEVQADNGADKKTFLNEVSPFYNEGNR